MPVNEENFSSYRKIQQNWIKAPYQKGLLSTYQGRIFSQSSWYLALLQQNIFSHDPGRTKKKIYSDTQQEIPREKSRIKMLFVGGDSQDSEKARDLLFRIIDAMKLKKGEYVLCQRVEEVKSFVSDFLPLVIVSFGAIATNGLLGRKGLLSQIHGKFLNNSFTIRDGKVWTCPIVPVFHPDFLTINPSMKRTVWMDLQQVMKAIQ